MKKRLSQIIKALPTSPGVYVFKDKLGQILYIGKSGNIRARVKSYFQNHLTPFNPWKHKMLEKLKKIDFIETESEIEALILEARLIKKIKPPFNILMRDDKSYAYAIVTKEDFPRIFVVRESNLKKVEGRKLEVESQLGPFTSVKALRMTLKTLRPIFPYCTCKKAHLRPCLNASLKLCPGYCCIKNYQPSTPNYQQYNENIKNIVKILKGQRGSLISDLKKKMKKQANGKNFEKAALIRDQIQALETVLKHKKILSQPLSPLPAFNDQLSILEIDFRKVKRIEAYDISNIQGKEATGSMVVFRKIQSFKFQISSCKFEPDKSQYRRFKIRTKKTPDDIAMLKEVLKRRFNHPEWPWPDLILIDGGRTQLNAAKEVMNNLQSKIYNLQSIISLAKKQEALYTINNPQAIALKNLPQPIANLFKALSDEAHRFAITYHRKLREKIIITNK